jgi:MFS family permease
VPSTATGAQCGDGDGPPGVVRTVAGVSLGWLGISMVADGVPALLVPHQLAAAGRGAGELGWVTAVAIGLAVAAQPIAGAWSDRVGRTLVIGAGLVLAVAGLALLLAPSVLLGATAAALVGVSVVQGGYQGLLPNRVPAQWRGRAAGAKGLFDVGGAFAAFALLAGLLAAGRSDLAVGTLAIALVGALAVSMALAGNAKRVMARPRAQPARRPQLSMGFVRLVVARFLFLLGIYVVGRFLLLFVAERQSLGADAAGATAGLVLAVLTLATAVAALPAGWLVDRVGRPGLMLGGALIGALGIGLLPLAGSTALLVTFGALMAVGSALFGAASWALLADLVEGAHAGRLLGIANIGTAGAAAAAGLFGPVIDLVNTAAPGTGFTVAFFAAALLAAAGALVGGRADRRAQTLSSTLEVAA